MQNDWIIDVLTDLFTFAQRNGMFALAAQLDDTRKVAVGELAHVDRRARPEGGSGDGRGAEVHLLMARPEER